MYKEISHNKRNTGLLLFCFILFFVAVGYGVGYYFTEDLNDSIGFMGMFGIGAIIYALISYYAAPSITLAIAHAKEIKKADHPTLFRTVENLSIAAGVPTPKIYIIEDTALNAFATGRGPENASVAITRGLLEKLDKTELEGVMAHELSHVKNYDIRLQCVTVALIGLIALISDVMLRSIFYGRHRDSNNKGNVIFIVIGIALAILSPIIAKLMHLAISRQREYLADASGAMITRYPEGLASALEKIKADHEPLEVANKATAHMYIENPLRNEQGGKWLNKLFSSHPDTGERIKRLREMGV